MVSPLYIGIFGAIILAISWIPETIEIIKTKESKLNPKFAVIMWIGTLLLFTYSILIKDIVFILTNSFILFQISISLFYEFIVEKRVFDKK